MLYYQKDKEILFVLFNNSRKSLTYGNSSFGQQERNKSSDR